MIGRLFKRSVKSKNPEDPVAPETEIDHALEFTKDIRTRIYKYAFLLINRQIFGLLDQIPTDPNDEFVLAKKDLEDLGYNSLLDQSILTGYQLALDDDPDFMPDEYGECYARIFHNGHLSYFSSEEVKLQNEKILQAYFDLLEVIWAHQEILEDKKLRLLVRQKLSKNFKHIFTLERYNTAFCLISLNCDAQGGYFITFSLDYQINEMLTRPLANNLVRQFYNTTHDFAEYFSFEYLNADCLIELDRLNGLEESEDLIIKTIPFHNIEEKEHV